MNNYNSRPPPHSQFQPQPQHPLQRQPYYPNGYGSNPNSMNMAGGGMPASRGNNLPYNNNSNAGDPYANYSQPKQQQYPAQRSRPGGPNIRPPPGRQNFPPNAAASYAAQPSSAMAPVPAPAPAPAPIPHMRNNYPPAGPGAIPKQNPMMRGQPPSAQQHQPVAAAPAGNGYYHGQNTRSPVRKPMPINNGPSQQRIPPQNPYGGPSQMQNPNGAANPYGGKGPYGATAQVQVPVPVPVPVPAPAPAPAPIPNNNSNPYIQGQANGSPYGSSNNVNNPYSQGPANPYGGANANDPYSQMPTNDPYNQQSPGNNMLQHHTGGGRIAPQQTSSSQISANGFEHDLVKQNTGAGPNMANASSSNHYNNASYNNYDEAISLSLNGTNGTNNDGYYDQQLAPSRSVNPYQNNSSTAYTDPVNSYSPQASHQQIQPQTHPQSQQHYQQPQAAAPPHPQQQPPLKSQPTSLGMSEAANPNSAANNKKPEPKKPLDREEYNRRRINAENNESPEVQLLWVKAIIEATQEPSLISTIDVTGSELPNKLTTSKEIRKNRDVFLHKGLKRLKRLVSKNYPDANYYLGTLYTNGKILEKNYDKAFDYYHKSAASGSGDGMYRVAICYEMGIGSKQDDIEAFTWFKKSSQRHIVPAMFKLGMIYLKGTLQQRRSAARAIEWLEKAASRADENNPHALFELGKLYEGFYPIASSMESLTHDDAQFLRDLKQIIPGTDEQKALNLYIRAAKLNYAPAQSKLGWCYEYGKLGCQVDSKRSIGWYCRSAAQGYALAEMALCGWYLTGAKGLLESNDKEAYLWARKAAEKGLSKAEYALGHFKETGLGTERNVVEARKWYQKAAAQGHPKAIQRMQELNRLQ